MEDQIIGAVTFLIVLAVMVSDRVSKNDGTEKTSPERSMGENDDYYYCSDHGVGNTPWMV